MKIRFLISCLFILLLSNNSFSKQSCNNFYEDLEVNFNDYKLDYKPRTIFNDFGFDLKDKYNVKTDTFEFEKDKNGYYKIGKISDPNLINKISYNDLLISANGKDLRKKNFDKQIYIQDLFDDNEEVEFVFKNSKKYNLKIAKSKIELSEPFTDVLFKTISINEKNNTFNAGLVLNYAYTFETTDDIKDSFYDTAIKHLMHGLDGEKYTEACIFTTEEWRSLRAVDPAHGLEFINLVSADDDLIKSSYELKPYSKEIPQQVDLGWGNDLDLVYKSEGIFTFKSNFDLRNFPFDRQKLKIYLANRFWPIDENILTVSQYSEKSLNDFAQKNDILGWNIVNTKTEYKPYKGPNDSFYFDGVVFEIEIERKQNYYIYKIIFPIFLILLVCWSAIWINPKEIESRLTITIVCLLSLIAYNFVIDSELPKLEYLTIMDYIILMSYVYATVPNFLSVIAFNLIKSNKSLGQKIEIYGKRYGLLSYVIIVLLIVMVNSTKNPEHTASMLSWMIPK